MKILRHLVLFLSDGLQRLHLIKFAFLFHQFFKRADFRANTVFDNGNAIGVANGG